MAVAVGDYDAGAVCADFLEEKEHSRVVQKVRVLAYTDPAPGWLLMLRKDLPESVRKKVYTALTEIKAGHYSKVLSSTPWSGFLKPDSSEIMEIGTLVRKYKVPYSL